MMDVLPLLLLSPCLFGTAMQDCKVLVVPVTQHFQARQEKGHGFWSSSKTESILQKHDTSPKL